MGDPPKISKLVCFHNQLGLQLQRISIAATVENGIRKLHEMNARKGHKKDLGIPSWTVLRFVFA